MKHHRYAKRTRSKAAGYWRSDLDFVFEDGILDRAVVNDSAPAPLILISHIEDIVHFFCRIGLKDLLREHMTDLENPPKMPNPDDEIRMFRDFSYGFTVLKTKRQYVAFCGVWYFKNHGMPLDGHLAIGIAPPGMEGLVPAGMKNLMDRWKTGMMSDATFVWMQKGDELQINN